VARHWAGERSNEFAADDSVVEALEAAGAPSVAIEAARTQAAQEDCCVWAENWPVFEAFTAFAGQWRYLATPMGPPQTLGFDYACVESGLRLMGFGARKRVELFRLLRLMEAEALDVIRTREAAQRASSELG
jgi:hypothetical protein